MREVKNYNLLRNGFSGGISPDWNVISTEELISTEEG